MGKEAESDGVLEGESMPGDLEAAAEHIDGVMVSMRKVGELAALILLQLMHGIYHDQHFILPPRCGKKLQIEGLLSSPSALHAPDCEEQGKHRRPVGWTHERRLSTVSSNMADANLKKTLLNKAFSRKRGNQTMRTRESRGALCQRWFCCTCRRRV